MTIFRICVLQLGFGLLFFPILSFAETKEAFFRKVQTLKLDTSCGGLAFHDIDGKIGEEILITCGDQKNLRVYGTDRGRPFAIRPSIRATGVEVFDVADLLGDKRSEIVALEEGGKRLTIYRLTSSGSMEKVATQSITIPFTTRALIAQNDFNGDGRRDILLYGNGKSEPCSTVQGGIALFELKTDNTISPIAELSFQHWISNVVASDVDYDGITDLMVLESAETLSDKWLSFYRAKKGGGFEKPRAIALGYQAPWLMAGDDINGDGNLDLALGSRDGVDFLLGQGNGTFRYSHGIDGQEGEMIYTPQFSDITGDGNSDLLLLGFSKKGKSFQDPWNRMIFLYPNDGKGHFFEPIELELGQQALTGNRGSLQIHEVRISPISRQNKGSQYLVTYEPNAKEITLFKPSQAWHPSAVRKLAARAPSTLDAKIIQEPKISEQPSWRLKLRRFLNYYRPEGISEEIKIFESKRARTLKAWLGYDLVQTRSLLKEQLHFAEQMAVPAYALIDSYHDLADLDNRENKQQERIEVLQKALDMISSKEAKKADMYMSLHCGPFGMSVASEVCVRHTNHELARAFAADGKLAEAEQRFQKLIASTSDKGSLSYEDLADEYADVMCKLGKTDGAKQLRCSKGKKPEFCR